MGEQQFGQLTRNHEYYQTGIDSEAMAAMVQQIVGPLIESIGTLLRHNTEAMEQIAAAQQLTSQRISELERHVRLQTPLSKSQENCINAAIRARARELLDSKGYSDDKKAITKLSGIIRKSVLARYGAGSLREAPAYDYETAMKHVSIWKDMIAIRDVEKEARKRAEMDMDAAESPADLDAGETVAMQNYQPDQHSMRYGEEAMPV